MDIQHRQPEDQCGSRNPECHPEPNDGVHGDESEQQPAARARTLSGPNSGASSQPTGGEAGIVRPIDTGTPATRPGVESANTAGRRSVAFTDCDSNNTRARNCPHDEIVITQPPESTVRSLRGPTRVPVLSTEALGGDNRTPDGPAPLRASSVGAPTSSLTVATPEFAVSRDTPHSTASARANAAKGANGKQSTLFDSFTHNIGLASLLEESGVAAERKLKEGESVATNDVDRVDAAAPTPKGDLTRQRKMQTPRKVAAATAAARSKHASAKADGALPASVHGMSDWELNPDSMTPIGQSNSNVPTPTKKSKNNTRVRLDSAAATSAGPDCNFVFSALPDSVASPLQRLLPQGATPHQQWSAIAALFIFASYTVTAILQSMTWQVYAVSIGVSVFLVLAAFGACVWVNFSTDLSQLPLITAFVGTVAVIASLFGDSCAPFSIGGGSFLTHSVAAVIVLPASGSSLRFTAGISAVQFVLIPVLFALVDGTAGQMNDGLGCFTTTVTVPASSPTTTTIAASGSTSTQKFSGLNDSSSSDGATTHFDGDVFRSENRALSPVIENATARGLLRLLPLFPPLLLFAVALRVATVLLALRSRTDAFACVVELALEQERLGDLAQIAEEHASTLWKNAASPNGASTSPSPLNVVKTEGGAAKVGGMTLIEEAICDLAVEAHLLSVAFAAQRAQFALATQHAQRQQAVHAIQQRPVTPASLRSSTSRRGIASPRNAIASRQQGMTLRRANQTSSRNSKTQRTSPAREGESPTRSGGESTSGSDQDVADFKTSLASLISGRTGSDACGLGPCFNVVASAVSTPSAMEQQGREEEIALRRAHLPGAAVAPIRTAVLNPGTRRRRVETLVDNQSLTTSTDSNLGATVSEGSRASPALLPEASSRGSNESGTDDELQLRKVQVSATVSERTSQESGHVGRTQSSERSGEDSDNNESKVHVSTRMNAGENERSFSSSCSDEEKYADQQLATDQQEYGSDRQLPPENVGSQKRAGDPGRPSSPTNPAAVALPSCLKSPTPRSALKTAAITLPDPDPGAGQGGTVDLPGLNIGGNRGVAQSRSSVASRRPRHVSIVDRNPLAAPPSSVTKSTTGSVGGPTFNHESEDEWSAADPTVFTGGRSSFSRARERAVSLFSEGSAKDDALDTFSSHRQKSKGLSDAMGKFAHAAARRRSTAAMSNIIRRATVTRERASSRVGAMSGFGGISGLGGFGGSLFASGVGLISGFGRGFASHTALAASLGMPAFAPADLQQHATGAASAAASAGVTFQRRCFVASFSLPNLDTYCQQQKATMEMVNIVVTKFAEAVLSAVAEYNGEILFTNVDEIFVAFEDCSSACAAGVLVRDLHLEDTNTFDKLYMTTRPGAPFVQIMHSAVMTSTLGDGHSRMGWCECQAVMHAVKMYLARVYLDPPTVLVAKSITTLAAKDFVVEPNAEFTDISIILEPNERSPDTGLPIAASAVENRVLAENNPKLFAVPNAVSILKTAIVGDDDTDDEAGDSELGEDDFVSSMTDVGARGVNQDTTFAMLAAPPVLAVFGEEDKVGAGGTAATPRQQKQARLRRKKLLKKYKQLDPVVLDLWYKFDEDGNGTLDMDEVYDMLTELEIPIDDDAFEQFFLELDQDGSGTVTLDEFANAFTSHQGMVSGQIAAEIKKVAAANHETNDHVPLLRAVWKKYDPEFHDALPPSDIQKILAEFGIKRTIEEVEMLVEKMDDNGNNLMEFEELADMFSKGGAAAAKLAQKKERLQMVGRVMNDIAVEPATFSTTEQAHRDRALAVTEFVKLYLSPVLIVYIVYNAGVNLYRVAMGSEDYVSTPHIAVDMCLDIVYYLWFIGKLFFTVREGRGGEVLHERLDVLRSYVFTIEFVVDCLVVLPTDIAFLACGGLDGTNGTDRCGVYGYYRVNKILSVYHFTTLFANVAQLMKPTVASVLEASLWFVSAAHLLACLALALTRNIGAVAMQPMLFADDLLNDRSTTYLQSILWGMQSLSGQVRGPVLQEDDKQVLLMLFAVLVGIPLLAAMLATIGNILNTKTAESAFLQRIDHVRSYFAYVAGAGDIAPEAEQDVLVYYRHLFFTTGSLDITSNPLKNVPIELGIQMTVTTGLDMLRKVPIFQEACSNLEFVHEMASKLTPKIFEPKYTVMTKGKQGTDMFFITHGECHVVTEQHVRVFTLKKGNFFGEIALLHKVKRTATIETGDRYTNVLRLDKRDFDEVMETFPDCLSYISKAAQGRLNEILQKEEDEAKKEREARRSSRLAKSMAMSMCISSRARTFSASAAMSSRQSNGTTSQIGTACLTTASNAGDLKDMKESKVVEDSKDMYDQLSPAARKSSARLQGASMDARGESQSTEVRQSTCDGPSAAAAARSSFAASATANKTLGKSDFELLTQERVTAGTGQRLSTTTSGARGGNAATTMTSTRDTGDDRYHTDPDAASNSRNPLDASRGLESSYAEPVEGEVSAPSRDLGSSRADLDAHQTGIVGDDGDEGVADGREYPNPLPVQESSGQGESEPVEAVPVHAVTVDDTCTNDTAQQEQVQQQRAQVVRVGNDGLSARGSLVRPSIMLGSGGAGTSGSGLTSTGSPLLEWDDEGGAAPPLRAATIFKRTPSMTVDE